VFAQLLTRLGATLDAAGIPYMVIGGQAVLIHGEPRLTRDIDVTVGVGLGATDMVVAAMDAIGMTMLPEDPVAFARQTMVLPAVDPASGIRVDVILSFTEFESNAIARATTVSMGDGSVRVATAEDLVVLKVIAGRPRDLGMCDR
jgi:hypothetical protein